MIISLFNLVVLSLAFLHVYRTAELVFILLHNATYLYALAGGLKAARMAATNQHHSAGSDKLVLPPEPLRRAGVHRYEGLTSLHVASSGV